MGIIYTRVDFEDNLAETEVFQVNEFEEQYGNGNDPIGERQVTKIDKTTNSATVDTMGVSREASLDLMQEGSVKVGDYVLLHIGFIMNKIDEVDALSSLEAYREVLEIMDAEELQSTIIESENCAND